MVVQRSGAITAVNSERGRRSGSFVPTLKHAIEYLLAPDESQGYQRAGRSSILRLLLAQHIASLSVISLAAAAMSGTGNLGSVLISRNHTNLTQLTQLLSK